MSKYGDTQFWCRVVRGIVISSDVQELFEGEWSYLDLGCLDAPERIPTGSDAGLFSGRAGITSRGFEIANYDEAQEVAAAREQFGPPAEELLLLVYRLGVVNRCRQYTFQSVGEFLKWAGRKPYSGEVLEVMVSIDRRMVGSMFVMPGMALVAMANFQRWHCGRVAA